MLITFLQEVVCIISDLNAWRLAPNYFSIFQASNIFENRKVIPRYKLRMVTRIFEVENVSQRCKRLCRKKLNSVKSGATNRHKRVELWAKSIKDFVNLGRHFYAFPLRDIRKNPRRYARVPQAMAQFVLKIEKLSHIMGPTPILEMGRAYGLRPRLR